MALLTGKQCRTARSLLKWNLYDLANHLKSIPPKRLDSFEKGMVHIQKWENEDMLKIFKKAGIEFKADLDVTLKETKKDSHEHGAGTGAGAKIVLDADQTVISDTSAAANTLLSEVEFEIGKKRQDSKP